MDIYDPVTNAVSSMEVEKMTAWFLDNDGDGRCFSSTKPIPNVVLATGISEETCRRINLDYRDPVTIKVEEFQNREEEGILQVSKAGEMFYIV